MAKPKAKAAKGAGLLSLVQTLLGARPARGSVGVSNRKYVTGNETEDQLLGSGEKYPLQRLERTPTRRGAAAQHEDQERRRVERLFAGQIGRARADQVDRLVNEAQRGTPAAAMALDRAGLQAELSKLRTSPNSISDPVQKRIAEIKKLLASR